VPALPAGSGYQPGGGGGCVTAAKLAPRTPDDRPDACQTPAMPDVTDAEARVLDAVDSGWAVDRLTRLVAIPSVDGTDAESEIQHELAGWLAELGCDVDRWQIDLAEAASAPDAPGQEVGRTEAWGVVGTMPAADDGRPALILSGHTDVVPPGDLALWDGDPFVPRIVGGALHGRGACDMKGGVVAALAALAAVRASGVRLARPVALHGVVGEEDGGLGAWAALRRGHLGDMCVIPEPTAQAVVTANAGALTFRLEVTGHAAHGALRDQGVSAVELFALVHAGLLEFEAERQRGADPRFSGTRFPYGLSIGRVEAGDWASSVPDRLVAEGRYGVQLGEPVEAARRAFEERVAKICAGHSWLAEHPVRVTWVGGAFASGQLPTGHPLLPAMQQAVADAGAAVPPEHALAGGSDLRLYAAAGIPTLHYGPGDLTLAHGPLEKVDLDEVVTAARAFALLVVRTCGVR
jgi:acetylornithine deacetylase